MYSNAIIKNFGLIVPYSNQFFKYDTKIIHYCWLSNDPIPDDLKSA